MSAPGGAALDEAFFQGVLLRMLEEPIGLLISTNDFTRARAKLYSARRGFAGTAREAQMKALQFRVSPLPDGEMVVLRGAPPAEENYGI